MKLTYFTLPIISLLITGIVHGQGSTPQSQQNVQETISLFFDALSTRDSVLLKNNSTSDIILYENGSTWNLDSLILKAITMNKADDFKRSNTFDFVNTSIHENIAWVTYNLRSDVFRNGKQGKVHWLETVIMVQENKKWKIKVLHSTLIKREG